MPNFVRRQHRVKSPIPPPPANESGDGLVEDEQGTEISDVLPNFSRLDISIRILMVALMATFVVVISRSAIPETSVIDDFIMLSGFSALIALGSIIVLRLSAPFITGLPVRAGSCVVLFVMLLVSIVVTELTIWMDFKFGSATERWPPNHWWVLARTLAVVGLIGAAVIRYSLVNHRVEVETESKQDDRLQALQSRIRPHFMFNSLNSVASLIRSEPETAEKALEDLADVFRVLLADARKMVPIAVEGELARQYLEIEKIRLGERLNVRWVASNVPRSALIPSLTLQPLVENAVYHGIEPSSDGGTISVNLWSEGAKLKILISNPLPAPNTSHRKGSNIALDNVRERLDRHFGGLARIENIERPHTYEVLIELPVIRN